MPAQIRYLDRKDSIRDALLKCARTRTCITYSDLGAQTGVPARGPWMPVLDVLAREERAAGRPDVTNLAINKRTRAPGSIDYEPARRPTPAQRARLKVLQEECWAAHAGAA